MELLQLQCICTAVHEFNNATTTKILNNKQHRQEQIKVIGCSANRVGKFLPDQTHHWANNKNFAKNYCCESCNKNTSKILNNGGATPATPTLRQQLPKANSIKQVRRGRQAHRVAFRERVRATRPALVIGAHGWAMRCRWVLHVGNALKTLQLFKAPFHWIANFERQ